MDGEEYPDPELYMQSPDPGEEESRRRKRELIQKYRSVFGQGTGLEVLEDILRDLHYGETLDPENPAMIAEYNVAVTILANCGVLGADNFKSLISTMLGMRREPQNTQ